MSGGSVLAPWSIGNAQHERNWGYFAVAYFDLLGQGNKLVEMAANPISSEPPPEGSPFWTLLKATVGGADFFRRTFLQYWDGFLEEQTADMDVQGAQAQLWSEIRKELDDYELRIQGFSDTVILFAPLLGLSPIAQTSVVYDLFRSCFPVMLGSFARGLVPRGAIDIGQGIEIYANEIYGPVLASCHHLESQVADWPRIVAGDGVLEFLRAMMEIPSDATQSQFIRDYATSARQWIQSDVEGNQFVHWLHPEALNTLDDAETTDVLKRVDAVIQSSESEYESDPTLGPRYRKLREYFSSSTDAILGKKDD